MGDEEALPPEIHLLINSEYFPGCGLACNSAINSVDKLHYWFGLVLRLLIVDVIKTMLNSVDSLIPEAIIAKGSIKGRSGCRDWLVSTSLGQ